MLVLGAGEPALAAGDPAALRRVVTAADYDSVAGRRTRPTTPGSRPTRTIPASSSTPRVPPDCRRASCCPATTIEPGAGHHALRRSSSTRPRWRWRPIPYFHISGFGLALVATLNGAALLLETATEPAALVDLLVRRRVSHAAVVPTLMQRMVNLPAAADAGLVGAEVPGLRIGPDAAADHPGGDRAVRLQVPAELRADRVDRRGHRAVAGGPPARPRAASISCVPSGRPCPAWSCGSSIRRRCKRFRSGHGARC